MTDRRCGSCRYWEHWECKFPMPDADPFETCPVKFPDAATITYTVMTANRGSQCPCWEVKP